MRVALETGVSFQYVRETSINVTVLIISEQLKKSRSIKEDYIKIDLKQTEQ